MIKTRDPGPKLQQSSKKAPKRLERAVCPRFVIAQPATWWHTQQSKRFARSAIFSFSLAFTVWRFVIGGCFAATYEASDMVPPKVTREFRGAWVATVGNIDWPSRKGLSTAEQKAELVALLEISLKLKLNTIILQVRPSCDALYASSLEPWSEYLTGTMGRAPQPFYDPLAFAVEEAHKRGLELHAWFNPYRARNTLSGAAVSPNHISKTHPEYVRRYGSELWLDPGEKGVREYSLAVVMDVVRRYDIDGVHFDDYFYPYAQKDRSGNDMDFPDYSSWKRFGAAGRLNRQDWRRENVNGFIHEVYESIKATKPWVKFGISPFGIWRPGNPPQIKGFDAYAKIYADSRKWLANGWVDYLAPQLYWAIQPPEQSFPVLLKWWSEQNVKGRHLVAGLDVTKAASKWPMKEILNQIRLTRQMKGVDGQFLWDIKGLTRNPPLAALLEREIYLESTLTPESTWSASSRSQKPTLAFAAQSIASHPTPTPQPRRKVAKSPERGAESLKREWKKAEKPKSLPEQMPVSSLPVKLNWRPSGNERVSFWVLQTRTNGEWKTEILRPWDTQRIWNESSPEIIALTLIDRSGLASQPAVYERKVARR